MSDRRPAVIRVLLADDHTTVREALQLLVNAQPDMTVIAHVGDGRAAIEATTTLAPDIVVLDLSMPGMTGLAAARALKAGCPTARVIALTRHDDAAFVRELFDAGADGYVLKQSPSSQLISAIRLVAEGRRYLDPALRPDDEPRDPRRAGTPRPTDREMEVLHLLAAGHSNKDIGVTLGISIKTVETHKSNAMRKLGLRGRTDVVRYAIMNGWLK